MEKEKYFGLSPRIAKWKLDTPLENWLSLKADGSEFWKRVYMSYYYFFNHNYFVKGQGMAKNTIENHATGKDVKDYAAVVRDMIYCLHRFGFSFQDYCIYDFAHNHDLAYRQSFVADKLRYHYCDMLNSSEVFHVMNDKFACYKVYRHFYKRQMIGCFSYADKASFEQFLLEHSSFIYKPLEEHSGHGIEIFDTNQLDSSEFFKAKLEHGAFVLEELIEQGEEVARMHPQSVNSCRVLTFTNGDQVEIIGTTWRVGSGNSIKDNAGSGGMYAFINPQTGIVETDAINYSGRHFKLHPDTEVAFEGFRMPLWKEAMTMVREMATSKKGTTLIAWDIAYSKRGWVMVEANENGDWGIIQSNKKIGRKETLFKLMNDYFQTHKAYK